MTTEVTNCELCGEPMPPGETMFKFHGYGGPCPKPPLPRPAVQTDWRIGHAVTPKMRTHYWFRHMAVIRRVHPESPNLKETMDVEIYHGDGETTILHEPTEEWMTA